MEKIIHRLFKYLKFKEIPHTRFEKEVGLSNGYLKTQLTREADLGETIIVTIIDNCLDLNPLWLLTGKGEMLVKNKDRIYLNNEALNMAAEPQVSYGDKKKEIIKKIVENNELILKLIEGNSTEFRSEVICEDIQLREEIVLRLGVVPLVKI